MDKVINQKMKTTSIGLIPEDWDAKSLSQIGVFSKGKGVTRANAQSGIIPCVRYGEIYTSHNDYIRTFYSHISPEVAATATMLKKGDVLFAGSGETKEEIGKAVAFLGDEEAYAGGDIIILSPNEGASSKYLGYVLNAATAVNQKASMGQGDAVVHIHAKELSDVVIPFPKLEEQEKIADVLSGFDDMIVTLDKAIKKKRQIKEGLMQQLLTGKTRLPGFYGEWEELELGSILTYEQPGPFLVHSTDYVDSGVPVLTAGKTFILGYTNEDFGIYTNLPVIIFDDFVTESKYVDFPFKAKSSAMKMLSVRDKGRHNIRFIYDVMQLIDFPMTDHKRWWIAEYSHLKVRVPASIEEEDAIANAFFTIDGEIHGLEAQREKYALIKQGMMQELLTGKTRLI